MRLALLALVLVSCGGAADPSVPRRAVELRDLGLAELENERPEMAEQAYRQLIEISPRDPLGRANLAIALLRQQKYEEARVAIDAVLGKVADDDALRGQLLAIKSDVLQWTGDLDGALELMEQAVAASPDNLEILYSAYYLATTRSEEGGEFARRVLQRLAELRPENVVVMLQRAKQAVATGDRSTATGAVMRVGQLMWQIDPRFHRALEMANEALREDDLAAARVPVQRLENVLKISPMFQESLRELKTGIQGIPVARLLDEPEPESFGDPLEITFAATELAASPTAGRALAVGDFDGDEKPDVARIRGGENAELEIRLAAGGFEISGEHPAAGLEELLAADLDNDGDLDLIATGPGRGAVWLGNGDGSFAAAEAELGLSAASGAALGVIDFDIEGDLDVVVVGGSSAAADLYRNRLEGPLEQVGSRSFPRLQIQDATAVAASDLDRDGDLDLAIAHGGGVTWLDNLRQGRFVDRTEDAGLDAAGGALSALAAADFDGDGWPDLIVAGQGLTAWRNLGGRFEPWTPAGLAAAGELTALLAFDADNDGRLDLAAAGPAGVTVMNRDTAGGFTAVRVDGAPESASALAAADLDLDGDLDLVVAGPSGLHRLENRGGNGNHWLALRLRGLNKGDSKNNHFGVGSLVEVKTGLAYQFREASGDVVHLGLGKQKTAEVLRVVWTNGVPQNRLQVAGDQRIVEEQLLKGSCPFLYAWDGSEFAFVTDLLWGAPLGLPVAEGAWASADPEELVRIDGLADDDGVYRLRITEELWEAAFFDYSRLWVVDHPEDLEVASTLRVLPGQVFKERGLADRVVASRELRPVAAAWDGRGRDVTATVAARDEVYADGYRESRYQGVAAEPWTFTFDLGEAPAAPVRLHLDGWIFPTDASLNLALDQRTSPPQVPPRLEVEVDGVWRDLLPQMGFPAGKTKTMVLDLPALPPGASKLRIVTSLWLHWDRVVWTTVTADDEAIVRARLEPRLADLRYRGFSAMYRRAPNAPHVFDYARVRSETPWLPFPGRYTRYGDVRRLLADADDYSVILAPGDEIALEFDARELPPPAPGFRRTLFLESHGWDKDADRNTFEGRHLEPLPFRAMSGYPWTEGESYPDTPGHRAYRRDWLTREVKPSP
ncbi:MAG: FG-GAP-like repeat-containing protein [Thermoanaerobaculia bacterium]